MAHPKAQNESDGNIWYNNKLYLQDHKNTYSIAKAIYNYV